MDDKCIMENLLLTTKNACDLYLHGSIESCTPEVKQSFKSALNECLNVILSSLGDAGQPSFLTIFAGQDVSEEEAKEAERLASELYPDTDSVLLDGGQPLYYYVISAEF